MKQDAIGAGEAVVTTEAALGELFRAGRANNQDLQSRVRSCPGPGATAGSPPALSPGHAGIVVARTADGLPQIGQ